MLPTDGDSIQSRRAHDAGHVIIAVGQVLSATVRTTIRKIGFCCSPDYFVYVVISLNSMGPTPTPTRMRLSCNFINVYTTRLHVCTRASLTDNLAWILARKSARVGRVDGQVGEDCRPCPARGKLNGEDVCVGVAVCVSVGPMMLTATD